MYTYFQIVKIEDFMFQRIAVTEKRVGFSSSKMPDILLNALKLV